MYVRLVPPVKSTIQQILFESTVYDQVLTRGKVRLKRSVNVGQLFPRGCRGFDFLLGDQEPKVRKG